jgi:EmrB/QacA subfamily drug resistance transporter
MSARRPHRTPRFSSSAKSASLGGADATTSSRHGVITAVVCLALAAVVAAMASLNVALPEIARDTHASQTDLVWVIDAYSLAFASLLLIGGGIGDRYGRRVALILGLSIFIAGSVIAIAATTATELIALRATLGVGAALVMPATLSTITSTFPESERTGAVSIWSAVGGGAAILGLLASGLLLAAFSWRSIFALNVVLGVAALAGTLRFVPESADPNAPKLDVGGAAIVVAGLVALIFSVIEAPTYGWLATRTLAGLIVGFALLGAFILWELRQEHPLLDPRVFRNRSLSMGSMSIFVQFFAFFGFTFIGMQYLQLVRGDSPLLAAVQVLPLALAMVPTSRLAPALTARYSTRTVCAGGLALLAAGLAIIAQAGTDTPYGLMAAGLVVLGVGMGAAMTPATSAITEALPLAQQGVGSALNDLSREVGGATGIAVIGSILTSTYSSHVNVIGLSSKITAEVRASYATASRFGTEVSDRAHAAFVTAMHVALLTGAGAALLASLATVILLARRSQTAPAREPEDGERRSERRGSLDGIRPPQAGPGQLFAATGLASLDLPPLSDEDFSPLGLPSEPETPEDPLSDPVPLSPDEEPESFFADDPSEEAAAFSRWRLRVP